jgi:energy-coupling factor transport system ATP-binding protein
VPIVEISGLTHNYEGDATVLALSGIDVSINAGEFVAVIGRNGSGKSTLAKHLNAILLPDEGRVLINGMDTRDEALLWLIRQSAGMVFQNPDNQIVATVVEEDVAFGPENLGVPTPDIHTRVDESLRQVDMLEYRGHAPHLLSGGQKQRVAIAGILAMRPDMIVLDEATAMLDPVGREEVMGTLIRLNREEGMTVIIITHHMDEAVRADRVLVLDEGRIVLQGTPTEVFAQYEILQRLGLDVPTAARLARELRDAGVVLPAGILTVDQLVGALCL